MTTITTAPLATEHVFDYQALLEPPVVIGSGPSGTRVFWQARGGVISGPRLNGEVLPGGGDWSLTGNDGWTRLDVRGQCRTDDGAILYLSYCGVASLPPRSGARSRRAERPASRTSTGGSRSPSRPATPATRG